ncbi:MAG TPA: undecaprenyl-diphosphatase UppP [Syntrophomonas sp.]|nr:undecaprenyl-diphosphatase UppP [Syntrophomonas sp.]
MTLFQSIIMGLVQGLGEFLPISSSAHLVLVPWLFSWHDPGLTFDVALHLGTLFAVIIYFWKDWLNLISSGLTNVRSKDGRLFWYLVAACIPGGLIGFLLESYAETVFRTPLLIAVMLIVMGIILYWADQKSRKATDIENISFSTAMWIGVSQALAIIPGVSRSGITITVGLLAGLTRESAARFSFLLSTPIIFGAALVKMPDVLANPAMIDLNFVVGMIVSAIVGLASIYVLLKYVQSKSYLPFAWYRFALGAIVIAAVFIRG